MSKESLLIEIGTEELPPRTLKKLSAAFSSELLAGLSTAELIEDTNSGSAFATPRRLALLVPDVLASQPVQTIERRGPALRAAFDDSGNATPAALGFAKSCGVEVANLARLTSAKGEWLSYRGEQAGKTIAELVPDIIDNAIKCLPIAKRMRWGAGDFEFVRPVHWLIVMHGATVIPTTVLGNQASNTTRGHRFHGKTKLIIQHAQEYQRSLKNDGHVVASFEQRQALIKTQTEALADKVGAQIEPDQALLDEVTGLVELPNALLGSFDTAFLQIPQECLISSMRDHQKYFHLLDKTGKLLANFITVSNIKSKDPKRVIRGNERVLRARLSDARFFWESDQKQPLASRLDKLDGVLFHIKLGSILDKSYRLEILAGMIAEQISADVSLAKRGALLAKTDLVSDMVGEFDDLQGIMGRYYADIDGEPRQVGECIEQHYWPKFSGDQLPKNREAQAVALADKLDSLVGLFGAGESPTGDKDPYAMRRAALSILRILIEQQHPLGLSELVANSAKVYQQQQSFEIDPAKQQQIVEFIRSRLIAYYQNQKIATTIINSVMACTPDSPLDFENRLKAVNQFVGMPEASDLAAANKRISNILKKQTGEFKASITTDKLTEKAEIDLHAAIETIEQDCLALFEQGDYNQGLQMLATLRTFVDKFFDEVMVMSDDPLQQSNRLSLLRKLQQLFLRVADISIL